MNFSLVVYLLGRLSVLLGGILALSAIAAAGLDGTRAEVLAFLAPSAVSFLLFALSRVRAVDPQVRLRAAEGFCAVTGGWLLACLLGALPYWMSGAIPGFTDAFFESASGFTTTGASILRDVESLPRSLLLWRSLTQWLGGMGIVALFVALLPALGAGGNFLFQAEVPGPTPGRIKPRISDTAKLLWMIYLGLTLAEILLLSVAGMSLFDSINHSFTTLSTGGFSTRNGSLSSYGAAIQWIVTLFMFLGGVNFAMHYLLLHRRWRAVLQNEEVRLYGSLVLLAILAVVAGLIWLEPALPARDHEVASAAVPEDWHDRTRHAAFQVVSVLTTTGFGSNDFDRWPHLCRVLLVLLMFAGACAGSTAGGIKLARVMLLFKYANVQLRRVLAPSAVLPVKVGKRNVDEGAIRGTLGFFLLFTGLYVLGVLVLLACEQDPTTACSASVACLSNIGPGLGGVGPTASYADLPGLSKWVLTSLMLLGRLEIYSVILLFFPQLWKK